MDLFKFYNKYGKKIRCLNTWGSMVKVKLSITISRAQYSNPLSTNHNYSRRHFIFFFFFFFSKKISLDILCELSAMQTIHIKYQDLFSMKNKKKKLECLLLQILLGTLRVNLYDSLG